MAFLPTHLSAGLQHNFTRRKYTGKLPSNHCVRITDSKLTGIGITGSYTSSIDTIDVSCHVHSQLQRGFPDWNATATDQLIIVVSPAIASL